MKPGIQKMTTSALFLSVILMVAGCTSADPGMPSPVLSPTQTEVAGTTATPPQDDSTATPESPAPTDAAAEGWQIYTNDSFQIQFQFPSTWFGPDVYETEDEIRLAVGSDKVYPYGTDRTEQIFTVENSYYITIQYRKNPGYGTLEEYSAEQPWLDTYLSLISLEDGESISSPRSLTIREREVTVGNFQGIEYIATLSETAQTEPVYLREVIMFDDHLNLLRVSGSPNNVVIPEGGGWREAYQQVDQENNATFDHVLQSITVNQQKRFPRLRHIAVVDGESHRITKALDRLHEQFERSIRIESLADEVGMSVSSFHQHFKAVTEMTPLQFQKQLRLQEARRLMLAEDLNASSAGYRVGYRDASHFSREYKEHFGDPPRRDVEPLWEGFTESAG